MKTLNLANLDKSNIKYKISQFPDGQQDIVITKNPYNSIEKDIIIKSRFNSFRDLELIICTTKALRRLGEKTIHLYIPYLLGARSDRHFQEGGNSYLVDIVAPIINAQGFESVTVMDVHSDVAPACINNLKINSNRPLVSWAFNNLCTKNPSLEGIIVISPDAGAQKKIYSSIEGYMGNGIVKDVITASKHRDLVTGNILDTVVPYTNNLDLVEADFVIIDDICDGGRTFIEIAKKLKENYSNKIHLIVTHGIFSNGYKELQSHFTTIYCTNSYSNVGPTHFDGWNNKPTSVIQIPVI